MTRAVLYCASMRTPPAKFPDDVKGEDDVAVNMVNEQGRVTTGLHAHSQTGTHRLTLPSTLHHFHEV